ncbi:von Willebrand factor A domain-containing protein 7-like, partial [Parambassis ranga]|uniref:von Willebrand factor A domain-containing protein 7-like n=1 Tax=Parambassis ranga TaxID=210632 RepID=A0A6P7JLX2_9TELE
FEIKPSQLLPPQSLNHWGITESALLNVTVQVCRALAKAEGTDFTFPTQPFTAEGVAVACRAPQSSKTFSQAIQNIKFRNARVDIRYPFNASFHFDEEKFVQGRKIITEGIMAVKASNKQENYELARQELGEILHPLQDFYSHSNWVELGNTLPNSNLIRPFSSIGNIADKSRATCRSCDGNDCSNNILEDIISEQILTSGYFGVLTSTKPKGKCSHGEWFDRTSKISPTGGINKDSPSSSHGHLHTQAANLAIAATSQLLEDIRGAAGDRPFLQMMGISRGSSKALCFVIDTTKSMSDELDAVKTLTSTIIDTNVGTKNEPSVYILVTFNDPAFGPLIRTTDAAVFKNVITSLTASGGGDNEEMILSGLQLALTGAPFNSEIFLFTDSPAKDTQLKSTIIALIERTQTVVNFLITGSTVTKSWRRSELQQSSRITAAEVQLYRDLAQASGGQVIEVTQGELPTARGIITKLASSYMVTILQAVRSPGKADSFSFIIDQTVTNPTIYITGSSFTFTVIRPTGESQSTEAAGSVIKGSVSAGNFKILQLNKQVGLWEIKMVSTNPYTVKVIGQSAIDFLFDFVEMSQGPFGGFYSLETRPRAGTNGSLLISVTGSDSATVTDVTLVESLGSEEIKSVVVPQGNGNFLAQVNRMPSAEFVVRVMGRDDTAASSTSIIFQRQSSTNFRASNLTITADSDGLLVPGEPFSVPFFVMTNGRGGNFTIRATNDRQFDSASPTSLFLESGSIANGTVTLSAPLNTPSGTDLTLTIEAEAPEGADTNYVVLYFSVLKMVTDFVHPVCEALHVQSTCSKNCSSSSWDLSARVTDGADGVGVEHLSLRQGNGTLNTSLEAGNENITLVSYTASCCSPDMELLVVDRVGNVGSCSFSTGKGSSAALSGSTLSPFLYLSIVALGLYLQTELGDE